MEEEGLMNNAISSKVRSLADDLDLYRAKQIEEDMGKDSIDLTPLVPVIVWILSAAFILSK